MDWIAEARKTFERNAKWFYLTAAAFFALSLLYLRRLRHSEEAMFAGLAWLFIGSQVAVYDYVTLTLVPLLFWRDQFVWKWLGISWIVVCLFSYVLGSAASLDWGYRWINVILAVYFAGMLAWFAFARERAPSGV